MNDRQEGKYRRQEDIEKRFRKSRRIEGLMTSSYKRIGKQ